jgi:hypothetical protein
LLLCLCRPCAANASAVAALSTVAATLPHCLRCSANAATALPTPFAMIFLPLPCSRCRCRPVTLLPHCSPLLNCHHRHHCHHCVDTAALALPTPPPRVDAVSGVLASAELLLCCFCKCCHCAANASTALPPLPPCSRHRHRSAAACYTTLSAVAKPLSRCLRCSAGAATVLPPLTSHCRRHCCAACC